jgi:hypothetical protein
MYRKTELFSPVSLRHARFGGAEDLRNLRFDHAIKMFEDTDVSLKTHCISLRFSQLDPNTHDFFTTFEYHVERKPQPLLAH